ncbi:MAG TPA: polysaccharide biosynthesis tyrosine autokinase, partial [Acidimicrobiales bacterium]|nr:polysaccharide biosynthesis tyrosine autokinase [Acidimicrobiales bacterium]
MADDVSLGVFFQDLLRRWKVATGVAAAVVIGAAVYASSLPNTYEGKAVLAFAPRAAPGGGTNNIGADTVRVVLPKYVAYVTSQATLRTVATRLKEDPDALVKSVDATITADSGNITIRTELPGPNRAAAAANALAAETLTFNNSDALLEGVIVAPALPSNAPSGPPRTLIELAALIVGVLLGSAVALLLERGRPRVRTWRDVGLVTGYPVVGRVPPARALKGSPVDALVDPTVGASVRTLRTNLERLSRDRPVHVVVVTSSVAGEGKTTVAGTLAITLARLDAEVLLIDGDLRRPGLTKLFELKAQKGLNSLLRGACKFHETLQPGRVHGLKLLPTEADVEAGDLLARRFAEVLREARQQFDVIVVDAPPLLGGDDARTLAALCDGVLMVVAADTLAASVSEAASALDGLGVRVLGAVANRARDPRGFGAYGAYGTYGMYGVTSTPAPAAPAP